MITPAIPPPPKMPSNVHLSFGGLRVAVPTAVLAAVATVVATRLATPSAPGDGAHTAAVQALADNVAGLRVDLRVLTERVNTGDDAGRTRDGALETKIDALARRVDALVDRERGR